MTHSQVEFILFKGQCYVTVVTDAHQALWIGESRNIDFYPHVFLSNRTSKISRLKPLPWV